MQNLTDEIKEAVADAFEQAGYDRELALVKVSDRPDLAEYQSNGAMAGAKKYHKAPLQIATEVAEILGKNPLFEKAEAVAPGFINLDVTGEFVCGALKECVHAKRFGVTGEGVAKKTVLDFGGANIAKPLHVGHLRSAIIGECLKRLLRYCGAEVTGDVHLGDWGMPMGLIIASISEEQPDLPYFDASYTGAYPKEPPFSITELEDIYPKASARSKEDEAFHAKAMEMTSRLQAGDRGIRALWHHISNVSGADLKKNYARLGASFDLWRGESYADPEMGPMVEEMKRLGIAHESDGAIVVDVAEETDSKEIPPCLIQKSDGAALYATSDLATIKQRMAEFGPEEIVYCVDKRQEMHFVQVFRTARKARLVLPETKLSFVGFGTMNGKDGKPFKTRNGGLPRLSDLLDEVEEQMLVRIRESEHEVPEEEAAEVAKKVALAALKYADLSNQPSKDYIFDPEKFTAFEGDTGPYLLYTVVRIKSILEKAGAGEDGAETKEALADPLRFLKAPHTAAEKNLMMKMCGFSHAVESAARELMPNRLTNYLYELTGVFNSFYHDTKILAEADKVVKMSYLALLKIVLKELETGIDILGFSAPDRM